MTAERPSRQRLALGLLAAGGLAAVLAWAFASYFRADLLLAFATWVQSCF